MNRTVWILCCLALIGGLFWQFPLFYVVRSDTQVGAGNPAAFNPAGFAESFWDEQLSPSFDDAPDAAVVLAALRENPHAARQQFGRKVGISRVHLFILRGSGTIVSVDGKGVRVTLQDEETEPDLVLDSGLLFGNVVRDVTGLLDPGKFSNSQYFNEISTELNRIVEMRVIPKLKQLASPGQKIQFVACSEVPDNASDFRQLKLIVLDVNRE